MGLLPRGEVNVQTYSFPGCTMSQAAFLLRNRTPTSISTDGVILNFGFSDRATSSGILLGQALEKLLSAAEATFPYAKIWFPLINTRPIRSREEKQNLEYLNTLIHKTPHPIPLPEGVLMTSDAEGIHRTPATGDRIWEQWRISLGIRPITKTPTTTAPGRGVGSSVINLAASFRLNAAQKQLLEKGLSFTPTVRSNLTRKQELLTQLRAYHRRLKLHAVFNNQPRTKPPPFQRQSGWEPEPALLPLDLLYLIEADQTAMKDMRLEKEKDNLSPEERQALNSLRRNTSIVIKPADKGGATVILDRSSYIQEALRQLNDTEYYIPLEAPIYEETAREINQILNSMVRERKITLRQKTYLTTPEPRKRQFYLLPKIHKAPETWPIPFITPAGRPIVSDCGSESYQIAEFLDHYLNPLSHKHDSYLKDTYDFLQKVKSIRLEEPCGLFTLDVEGLYTNIDAEMGLNAVEEILNRFPNKTRPDREILRLLELSLTKNDFEFDGRQYLQIKGTAMGKRFAPAYADIYMAAWEETILPQCAKRPPNYFRYLDDIWGTWPYSDTDFQTFLDTLNKHHPSIKVKAVTNAREIDFLDVTTSKGTDFDTTGRLDTRVYFKPTDSHTLLHRSSFHPRHTFEGIIKSQFIRFERICSQGSDYNMMVRTLQGPETEGLQ